MPLDALAWLGSWSSGTPEPDAQAAGARRRCAVFPGRGEQFIDTVYLSRPAPDHTVGGGRRQISTISARVDVRRVPVQNPLVDVPGEIELTPQPHPEGGRSHGRDIRHSRTVHRRRIRTFVI